MIIKNVLKIISEDDKSSNILNDMVYLKDYKSKNIIIFSNNMFYIIPINNTTIYISLDYSDIPNTIVKDIVTNVLMSNNYKNNKMYKTTTKYPTLEILLGCMTKYYAPSILNDKILVANMSTDKKINLNFQEVVNFLLQNINK